MTTQEFQKTLNKTRSTRSLLNLWAKTGASKFVHMIKEKLRNKLESEGYTEITVSRASLDKCKAQMTGTDDKITLSNRAGGQWSKFKGQRIHVVCMDKIAGGSKAKLFVKAI